MARGKHPTMVSTLTGTLIICPKIPYIPQLRNRLGISHRLPDRFRRDQLVLQNSLPIAASFFSTILLFSRCSAARTSRPHPFCLSGISPNVLSFWTHYCWVQSIRQPENPLHYQTGRHQSPNLMRPPMNNNEVSHESSRHSR